MTPQAIKIQLPGQAPSAPVASTRPVLRLALIATGLVALTALTYAPVLRGGFEFVNIDDEDYVAENQHVLTGLTRANVAWAVTSFHAHNWHPLTWLSLQLDAQVFGASPATFHRANVVWHLANVVWVFLALHALSGRIWPSAVVAALFGVHPLHAESVAWVAERKDVLSGFFWMATLWAYAGYTRRPCASAYLVVMALFVLGLLAKPMLVTLPCVLLLLDYWPLGRRESWPKLFLEKAPLFALAAASSVLTTLAQRRVVKATGEFPLAIRLGNGLAAYGVYLRKTFWPSDLAVFYPHPHDGLPAVWVVVGTLVLIGGTLCAFRVRRTLPPVTVGWLWYVGTLVPVIGLVQVGNQAFADRYTYIPLVGVFIALAWSLAGLPRGVTLALTTAALAACVVLTQRQLHTWRDSIQLWKQVVRKTNPHPISHFYLGDALDRAGRPQEALAEYRSALRMSPYPDAHRRVGAILEARGDFEGARREYELELRYTPESWEAYEGLGRLNESLGRPAEAAADYAMAVRFAETASEQARLAGLRDKALSKVRSAPP